MIEISNRPVAQLPRRRHAVPVALLLATTALTSPLLMHTAMAQNLPTGGSVAAGSVAIAQPSATQLNITQSSQSAIVNWQGFSVGQGSTVNIAQPNASSAILNRVTGNTPSSIAGQINANGQVYLVNPNGIAITSSGTVNVGGGFVASTLGISDSDFMGGKRTFTGNGASAGVSNAGTITVGRGGYAALIGGTVDNSGSISVPLGKVGLGSGERATLDFSGDGFLQVAVPTAAGGTDVLISHSGSIKADGGSVIITAATAREAARNAVNISGIVQARSISGRDGAITIGGGDGGKVAVSGRLTTASKRGQTTASGGKITVTGRDIALSGAKLNASGKTGGGSIKIGGDYQGTGDLQRAQATTVDATTTIKADAITSGNGGTVVVWSDQLTRFAGTISAKGGTERGNGGNAEVSGKALLGYNGTADLRAASGRFGTLLLDPYNVTISSAADTSGFTAGTSSFTASSDDSIINVGTLITQLGLSSVTISTGLSGSPGAQVGNITVAAPLSWSAATTLTLTAAGSIAINADVTVAGGGQVALNHSTANSVTGGLTFSAGNSLTFADGQAGQTLHINSHEYMLVRSMAGVEGISEQTGRYALARDLDASGIAYAKSPADALYGTLDGLGHTISNLSIDAEGFYGTNVGLIGSLGGTVRNIGLIGGSVAGQMTVGALVGLNYGTVLNAYATTSVIGYGIDGGESGAGGLIGSNDGAIHNSFASGAVSGTSTVGGLAGTNSGSIVLSHATGTVSGSNQIGGLIGYNAGGVTASYASGTVSGIDEVGGLVGRLDQYQFILGDLTQVYATGDVNGRSKVGGLIGHSLRDITGAYATGMVIGSGDHVGGLVGYTALIVYDSYASGAVYGASYVGGLMGVGLADHSHATGAVSGSNYVGGLVGDGFAHSSYATGAVTGANNVGALAGMGFARDSHASGAVSGVDNVGGLIGYMGGGAFYVDVGETAGSYATGAVTGINNVGGLVGRVFNLGTVRGSYATGTVHGVGNVGGLVGSIFNTQTGSARVFGSFATGAVSGDTNIGGLAGENGYGFVAGSYATGAVSGGAAVGGLVGTLRGNLGQYEGVTASYATGAVTGATMVGGLVGQNNLGSVTNGYWDTLTSGQSTSAGGTALTTRQLQGLDPLSGGSYFSVTVNLPVPVFVNAPYSGGANGLYPYLASFYPGGVQAISGYAYNDAGVTLAASGTHGPQYVYLDIAGSRTAVTAGANGYYYVMLPNGTLASTNGGTATLAYTLQGNVTGPVSGASLIAATGTTRHLDVWGNTLIAPTTATSLSTAPTTASDLLSANSGANTSLLASAAGSDGAATPSALGGLNSVGYIATSANGFNVDQGISPYGLYLQTTNGPITVTSAQTLGGPINLSLLSADALTINAAIQVNGAGAVNLAYNASSTANLSFGLTGSGFTGSLTFANADGTPANATQGGALSINGNAYALLYSMADIGSVNANPGGRYALAGSLDAAGPVYTDALIAGSSSAFTGAFDGLGHTIRNLTIDKSGAYAGLFGYSSGTIRDIGLVGGSVSGSGSGVGGLVGYQQNGTISSAYATGAVSGSSSVGGLVGFQDGGAISTAYATGAVSGSNYVGGLVGQQSGGTISTAYATGAVSGSGSGVGGLVGRQLSGTISTADATGAVSGSNYVGGLVGQQSGGAISTAYATGAVNGSTSVGGLVGYQQSGGSTTNSYWDISTTGQSTSAGGTGLTTADFQTLAAAADLGSAFAGGANGLYPYLKVFYPDGVQAISGIAYREDGSALASGLNGAGLVTVNAGGVSQTVTTGVNGYYYAIVANGTIDATNGTSVLATTVANAATGATFTTGATGSLTGFNVVGGLLNQTADAGITSLSALNAAYNAAAVGTPAASLTFDRRTVTAAASSFAIDAIISNSGAVRVTSGGDIAIASGATVTGGSVTLAASGAFVNNQGSNAVTATTGRWLIYSANPASNTFGNLDSDNTAIWNTAAGATVTDAGNRYVFASLPTITVTSTNGTKVYGEDATAQVAGLYTIGGYQDVAGAYKGFSANVFSGTPDVTSLGSPTAAAVAGSPYAITASVGSMVVSSGYALAFDNAGVLTVNPAALVLTALAVKPDDVSKTYGQTWTFADSAFTTTGLRNGDSIGSVTLASTGATATAGVGSYAITASNARGGTFNPANYTIRYLTGTLTVNPAALLITADAQSRALGAANPALTWQASGLVNGDTLTGGLATLATAASGAGAYAITQGSLAASNNYTLTYQGADLTIVPLPPVPPSPPVPPLPNETATGPVQPGLIESLAANPASLASTIIVNNGQNFAPSGRPPTVLPTSPPPSGFGLFYADPRFDAPVACPGGNAECMVASGQ